MSLIKLSPNKIVVATLFLRAEIGWKYYQRQTAFLVTYIHWTLFKISLLRQNKGLKPLAELFRIESVYYLTSD